MTNTLVVCQACEKTNLIPFARAQSAQAICGSCKANLPFHDGVQDVNGSTLLKLVRGADRPLQSLRSDFSGGCPRNWMITDL